jgi:hypothetical protein
MDTMYARLRHQLMLVLLPLFFLVCLPIVTTAQESTAKTQAEIARNQEIAAKNNEFAARLAEDASSTDPEAVGRMRAAALRAQEAANRSQDAASKAQDAASREPVSVVAQVAANKAQESANAAQESANRAQEVVNRSRLMRPASSLTTPAQGSEGTRATSAQSSRSALVEPPKVTTAQGDDRVSEEKSNPTAVTNPQGASPSTTNIQGLGELLNKKFRDATQARLGPKNNTNQNETPSISTNSTSLVDKSSVGDLVSFAVNPAGTSTNTSNTEPTSSSITITAYAFKAFASGRDPLDPGFYTTNRRWRKLSFTYGYDYTKGNGGDPQQKGNIYGIKFLPYDKRDVSDPANNEEIRAISDYLKNVGQSFSSARSEVEDTIFDILSKRGKLPTGVTDKGTLINFLEQDNKIEEDLAELLGDDIKIIDNIVAKYVDPNVRFTKAAREAFDRIRRKPQIAIEFLTKQRKATRPDEYMGGLVMDIGVLNRWNLTFNGMFNLTDNKPTKNSTGGTFGTELQIPLNGIERVGDRVPWTFSFGASGRWMTGESPRYQGQAKLTIPFPRMPGVELPISVSFANRSELLKGKESKVIGHIGLTFDLAKLLTAFKNQLALSAH